MRRLIIAAVVLIAVIGIGYFVWQPQSFVLGASEAAAESPSATAAALPAVKADPRILAEARVVPAREASLGTLTGGIVSEVMVSEGEHVEAGQLLLQLADARQRASVAQAEAALQAAQARAGELRQGPRLQEIDAAQATVRAAQARLDQLLDGPRSEDIAVAEAGLASAQATLAKVLEGSRQEEVTAARAEMASAEAALKQAQSDYDRLGWRNDRPAMEVSLNLEQATNTFVAAQGRYEALARGATNAEIATARAGVQRAEAELARVKASVGANEIAAARAEVDRAQAQLRLLQAGARSEQIAAAEADVAAAQASLEQAKATLDETRLYAPFSGNVASISVEVGESVTPGTPLVTLADLSGWFIETEDLTEIQVVDIQEGDSVAITFDAMPELELKGQVVRIKPMGESRQGDITYAVRVQPSAYDQRMRWNMTTVVAIEPSILDQP